MTDKRIVDKSMTITCSSQPATAVAAEALVSFVFEPEKEGGKLIEGAIAELDQTVGGAFRRLAESGELTGKKLETTLVHFVPGLAAQRVLLVGAGKRNKFGNAELRRLSSVAARFLKT